MSQQFPDGRGTAAEITAADAARLGARSAVGFPSLIVLTSMMGFGSLAADGGMSLLTALAASAAIWGLPGQVAMAELWTAGAGLVTVVLAVSLANARFMPMAMSIFPLMRGGLRRRGQAYLLVQLLSVNTWAACHEAFPLLPPALRTVYYTVFGSVLLAAGQVGTALGFFAVALLPGAVTLGLIFLNPCYFALLFAATRSRPYIAALLMGAVAGPAVYALTPEWSLLLTGFIAGTTAFLLVPPAKPASREPEPKS